MSVKLIHMYTFLGGSKVLGWKCKRWWDCEKIHEGE